MFSRVWVKSDLFKSLQRCQHTSQISLHMADSIAGSLAGRALGSVGASSAGQIIEPPLVVCAELGEIHLTHYPALLCERLRWSRSLLWCLGVVVQLSWDRKRIGLSKTPWGDNLRAGGPHHMFSYPLPFADPYPLTPNSPPPLPTKLPARVTATPALAYHTISWSPFQRAQNTSALFTQTLFWDIKSVCEYMHFHLNPV